MYQYRLFELLEPVEPDISFEEWRVQLRLCKRFQGWHLKWRIGDLLRVGDKFGEEAFQGIDDAGIGYSEKTQENLKYVAGRFPVEHRHEGPAYQCYLLLASVHPEEKRFEMAERAAVENWTVDRTENMIAEYRRGGDEAPEPDAEPKLVPMVERTRQVLGFVSMSETKWLELSEHVRAAADILLGAAPELRHYPDADENLNNAWLLEAPVGKATFSMRILRYLGDSEEV